MKKLGSIEFFENIDLDIKLDFNDLMDFIFAGKLLVKGVTDNDIIKQTFFDENNLLKMDKIELAVNQYVNQKIKEKFGEDYFLDVMDDTMNISWDINVESIKKHHEEKWWDEEEAKLPKLKKV